CPWSSRFYPWLAVHRNWASRCAIQTLYRNGTIHFRMPHRDKFLFRDCSSRRFYTAPLFWLHAGPEIARALEPFAIGYHSASPSAPPGSTPLVVESERPLHLARDRGESKRRTAVIRPDVASFYLLAAWNFFRPSFLSLGSTTF